MINVREERREVVLMVKQRTSQSVSVHVQMAGE